MAETYMDFITGEKFFTYGSSDPGKIRKLRRMIEERPDGVEVVMDDPEHGMMVRLPTKTWSYEPKLKRKGVPMSEETRRKAIERLEMARKARDVSDSVEPDE